MSRICFRTVGPSGAAAFVLFASSSGVQADTPDDSVSTIVVSAQRLDEERAKIMRDGVAIAEAGAFSLVIEGVAESVARELTDTVFVPTIGIGASAGCDGQILVTDDMLGVFAEFTPKFVKRYRNLSEEIRAAARDYAAEVRDGRFPAPEHTYSRPARPPKS